jgi:hypothetical protein
VFFAEANKIPNLLHEIGLREITFRGEKEESIDLDKFDQYPPSFLWDDDAKKLQEHIEWD